MATQTLWESGTELRIEDWLKKPSGELPLWRECFSVLEAALLRIAPVYYGLGVPHGDGSAVILIPGFLVNDAFMTEMWAWLYRMDYSPYFSGIGVNNGCPNLAIKRSLNATLDRALSETGRKVHLIGHSLGGMLAISLAAQRPRDVGSVIALASPFRGCSAHPDVLRAIEQIGANIRARCEDCLPQCYTPACPCEFVDSLSRSLPKSVMATALYSRTDAIVDWHGCVTGNPDVDIEVPGTHLGMAFNPSAYTVIAERLAKAVKRG